MDEKEHFSVAAFAGEELPFLDRGLLSIARWSIDHDEPAGLGTSRLKVRPPKALQQHRPPVRNEILCIPINTRGTERRVLLVARERGQRPFDDEESQLLETFANQAAIAVERTILVEEHTRAEILARSDELKTALLSAVSHDLRTPLASIKASATALQQPDLKWNDEDAQALIAMIDEETDRLNRLVTNLLDLSRIEAGELKPSLDWYRPDTLIAEALERCRSVLAEHNVAVDYPDADTLVEVDFVMIVEVLVNLIENAAKYSPAGARIDVLARKQGALMRFEVRDEGQGVPEGEEERIFDKFYRVAAKYRPTGSGMGLAISRGFVEAHGGRIAVRPNGDKGSIFSFSVSLAPEPAFDLTGAAGIQVEEG
jgi:two-component system sensor histidine kinase KdpD